MSNLGKDIYEEGITDALIEVAKEMLKNNEPMFKVVRYSKLSEEELQKLKEELYNQSSSEAKETTH